MCVAVGLPAVKRILSGEYAQEALVAYRENVHASRMASNIVIEIGYASCTGHSDESVIED